VATSHAVRGHVAYAIRFLTVYLVGVGGGAPGVLVGKCFVPSGSIPFGTET
jgi:hypothetical protein